MGIILVQTLLGAGCFDFWFKAGPSSLVQSKELAYSKIINSDDLTSEEENISQSSCYMRSIQDHFF